MSFFLTIGVSYGLINLWIVWWLWRALRGAGWIQPVLCLAVALLAACFPLFYRKSAGAVLDIALVRIGSAWLGVFIYIFFMVLAADLAALAGRFWSQHTDAGPRWRACAIVFGLPLCAGLAGWVNAALPVTREYDLTVKTRAGGPAAGSTLTIAALSDLHLGRTIAAARLAGAIDLLAPRQPDILLFLGDVLDDHILLDIPAMRKAVDSARPRLGAWGITGNHEYIAGDINVSLAALGQSGIRVLRDQWIVLEDRLILVGRDDYSKSGFTGAPRKSLDEILADLPAEYVGLPLLVLDHQPRHLEEAEKAGAALQLSGHTHNGQLWPFNLVVERVYENAAGYSRRNATQYIVSVGAGTWGPPMRTNSRPEALLIRLKFES